MEGGGSPLFIIEGGIGMFLPADFYSSWAGPNEVDLRLNPPAYPDPPMKSYWVTIYWKFDIDITLLSSKLVLPKELFKFPLLLNPKFPILRVACIASYSTSLSSISQIARAVSFDFRSFFLKPAFLSNVFISLGISFRMKVQVFGSQPACSFFSKKSGFVMLYDGTPTLLCWSFTKKMSPNQFGDSINPVMSMK